MRTSLQLAAYLALLFLASAAVSPIAYWSGQHLLARGWVPFLEGFRYPVYFARTLQILALATFWPFLRHVGVRRWADLGLRPNPHGRADLLVGFVLGAGGLGVVATAVVLAGAARPRATLPWGEMPGVVLAMLLVPLIEETLFRGALLGILRRAMRPVSALILLSGLYATLHFIKWRPGTPRGMPVEWYSGFDLLGQMLWPFTEPRLVLGGWCALFIAGLTLGDCVLRTGSLHLAIGAHGGWVLGLRMFEELFTRPEVSLWIGRRLTVGLGPLVALAVTWLLLRWWTGRRGRRGGAEPAPPGLGT